MSSALDPGSTWSRQHTLVFATTVALAALLPWSVHCWPSQDGQNHLAVAHVLLRDGDPTSVFSQYLTVQSRILPSNGLYGALCLLARILPLRVAEKVLVSAAVVLLPASLLLLVRRALPARSVNVMLGLPFVVGWAFAMGFLSFQIALGLGVTALALAWGPSREAVWGSRQELARHVGAAVLYLACVWFHPITALITGLVLLLLEGRNAFRPSQWARIALVVGPGALFLVGSYFSTVAPPVSSADRPDTHFADWKTVIGSAFEYNVAYSPFELVPRVVALAILLRFAVRSLRTTPLGGSSAEAAMGRTVLALAILYAVTPQSLWGWGYASTRFFLFVLLLLPAAADIPDALLRRVPAVGAALTVCVLAIQWPAVRHASGQMVDIERVGASLPRGAKLIPMDFTASVIGPQPLGHAWAELVVERDVVASQLFAAGKPRMGAERFRPLTFRPGLLDVATGKLPWSTNETWHEVSRACADPSSPIRWFVNVPGECKDLLADRAAILDAVVDRYDYVLMLDPPPFAHDLMARHLALVSQVGSAWAYRVIHDL